MTVLPPVVLRSGELSEAVGGQLMAGHRNVEVRSVEIDSRRVGSGDLFVAIHGQRFDGHQFIREAVSKGAAGLYPKNILS